MRVGQDLQLDVPRIDQILFEEDRCVAKRGQCFPLTGPQRVHKVFLVPHQTHSLATTTQYGFDEYGKSNLLGLCEEKLGFLVAVTVVPRRRRNSSLFHNSFRLRLAGHTRHTLGRRTNPLDACIDRGSGKALVLGQESVTGMNGIDSGRLGNLQDLLRLQIRFRRRRSTTNLIGLIRHGRMGAVVAVSDRVEGYRGNAPFSTGSKDATGDFAAICDENLGEGGREGREGSLVGGSRGPRSKQQCSHNHAAGPNNASVDR